MPKKATFKPMDAYSDDLTDGQKRTLELSTKVQNYAKEITDFNSDEFDYKYQALSILASAFLSEFQDVIQNSNTSKDFREMAGGFVITVANNGALIMQECVNAELQGNDKQH